ncbi:TALD3 protein, partial [Alcedo cyanopectus]|nr:TALD3 protein [Ceyx cyanopectus]
VFISQYATGQKEALRELLKQKTQNNPPVLKEVKVQLLGTEQKERVADDTRSAPREADPASTIAAATAAAIATTAPLLKIQNDLEAKVSSVSALLQKLQETDRQLQQIVEQQANMKTHPENPHCHQRVRELEKQISSFMVQIQHLEKLQEQQMNIQSHLLSSAVSRGGLQQVHAPSSSGLSKQPEKPEQQLLTHGVSSCQRIYSRQLQIHGNPTETSPLTTPVPRSCAPEPVPKNVKITRKENPIIEKENI